MSPFSFFSIAMGSTVAAAVAERLVRRLHRRRLRALAGAWKMTYSPSDEFRLTSRVVRGFPVAGAAKIRVVDLIYAVEAGQYRYIFTTEYTVGIVGNKRRVLRAGTLWEPRDRSDAVPPPLVMAPANLRLFEQYQKLKEANSTLQA